MPGAGIINYMGSAPFGNPFNKENFPDHKDPANRETGVAELYPERLQDEINESYGHDKVLPRVGGKDYEEDKEMDGYESPPETLAYEDKEEVSGQQKSQVNGMPTFPHKY